jgi:hypothetical protein
VNKLYEISMETSYGSFGISAKLFRKLHYENSLQSNERNRFIDAHGSDRKQEDSENLDYHDYGDGSTDGTFSTAARLGDASGGIKSRSVISGGNLLGNWNSHVAHIRFAQE